MMNNDNQPRWLSTGYLQAAPGEVNHENGIIECVSVTTEGEAKGHGVFLDEEFIDEVVKQGNAKKQGVKARFGHPNMCSTALGTFLGRFKHFRKDAVKRDNGQTAFRAVADLFLSNEAKQTPHGNLHDYVLNMAENEPDMFGTSIVFTPGRNFRKTDNGKNVYREWQRGEGGEALCNSDGTIAFRWVDKDGNEVDIGKENIIERDYVECQELHACDAVDDPAANDGLFSRFSQETIAGQITEFLDLHPQVWDALNGNDAVISAISQYGDKVAEFIGKYNSSKTGGGDKMSAQTIHKMDASEQATTEETEKVETIETTGPEGGEGSESQGTTETDSTFSVAEFTSMVDEFGADIAGRVVLSGGTKADAYKLQAEENKARAEKLESELTELRKQKGGGTAAKHSETGEKKTFADLYRK